MTINRFAYIQPRSYEEASTLVREKRYPLPMLKGGGMDVLDHLKEGLIEPDALINLRAVTRADKGELIREEAGSVRIAAGATMAQIASSSVVKRLAPVVAQALDSAATPHVRNVGTAAGNLLQRPRCWYYRNQQFDCLKKGGSTCFAVEGENKYHAILGNGPCHIVHPSNFAPALMVTGGVVHLTGSDRKSLPIAALYHLPDQGVTSEHNLLLGEVVTHVTFQARPNSGFYALKEKQSFDWPLAFACVALKLDGAAIAQAEVCAGAVAPVPWMLPQVAAALKGVKLDDDAALTAACAKATEGARPLRDNGYKLQLLRVAVKRAVLRAAGRPVPVAPGHEEVES